MHIIDAGKREPTTVVCRQCLDRGRRGGRAIFGSTNTADLHDWMTRHADHAPDGGSE